MWCLASVVCFFFNDAAATEIYTLSLHDALPISPPPISFLILSNIIHLDRQLWSLWWHKPHPIQNVLHCSQTRRRGCLFTLHQLAKGVECSRDQVTEIQVNQLSAGRANTSPFRSQRLAVTEADFGEHPAAMAARVALPETT